MIPREQIDRVLQSTNIVDVISDRIELRRSGSNFKGRCPFHDEKTASFMVSEQKQIFKCFGCGISGNVIKFVSEYDRIPWQDAVRGLAQKAGIELTEKYSGDVKSRDVILEAKKLLKQITDIYYNNLLKEMENEDGVVSQFLKKRRLTKAAVDYFKIGYAPDNWNFISNNRDIINSYDLDLLVRNGIVKLNEFGKPYDFFRGRVMFPIYDITGDVIAFSGRDIFDNKDTAKYLNSPESPLYNKGATFFGLYHSLGKIRQTSSAVLVEGNIDQVSLFMGGMENVIALCGTGLTKDHVKILKRNVERVVIMFDGDSAGFKSSVRSSLMILDEGLKTEIIMMPDNEDPDSYLKTYGMNKLLDLMNNYTSFVEFFIKVKGVPKTPEEKINLIREFGDSISEVKQDIVRDVLISEFSKVLGLNETSVKKAVSGIKRTKFREMSEDTFSDETVYSKTFGRDLVEFGLIYLMITREEYLKKAIRLFTEDNFSNKFAARLFFKIFELYEDGETADFVLLLNEIEDEGLKSFFIDFSSKQEEEFFSDSSETEVRLRYAFEYMINVMENYIVDDMKEKVKEQIQFDDGESDDLLMKLYLQKKNRNVIK
ncbi:MAG: DNA primase [Candidatus Delongbacteria bacterium]|nr:DNA primase [Candidatus Delongbacteria bacterium]MBN2836999.1 DNA primase [Candidatus Delongbacteria bacterium]